MRTRSAERLKLTFIRFYSWVGKPKIAVTIITGIAAALRLFHLGFKSLWLDEAALYWIANGDLKHILVQNTASSGPPLFALLLHSVMSISASEQALRAIPCLAGIVSIPLMYLLTKQFISNRMAYFAALLVAVAPSQINYSQQVREYSLAFLFAIGILLAFYLFLQKPSWRRSLLLGLVMFVSIFTQYGLALLILSINVVFIIEVLRFKPLKRTIGLWALAQVIGLFAMFAVYHLSLKHQFDPGGFAAYLMPEAYWDGSLGNLLRLSVFNTVDIFDFAFPGQLLILLCMLGLIAVVRSNRKWIVILLFVMPFVITFSISLYRMYPYMGGRRTIFLTPMIYVFAALGMDFIKNIPKSRPLIVSLAVLLLGYGLEHTAMYHKSVGTENIRPIVKAVSSLASEDDIIYVYYGADEAFRYYFQKDTHPWIKGVVSRGNPDEYNRQLKAFLAMERKVWLVFSHNWAHEMEQILQYLSCYCTVELVKEETGAWLYVAEKI